MFQVPVVSKDVGLVEAREREELSLSVVLGVLSVLCVTGCSRSPSMSIVALPKPMSNL